MRHLAAAVLIALIGAAAQAQPTVPADTTRVVVPLPTDGALSVLRLYGVALNGRPFTADDPMIVFAGYNVALFRAPAAPGTIGGMIVCNERINPPPVTETDPPERERVCGEPWIAPQWLPEPRVGASLLAGVALLALLSRLRYRRRTG